MANQTIKKRELILITLAAIALIYGALDFALRTLKGKNTHIGTGEAQAAATFSLITEELGTNASSLQEANALEIFNAVSTAWPEGVFVDITSFIDHEQEEDAFMDTSLIYSGYMTMGGKMLAVINGLEYRIGDAVEGFILKEIDPVEIVMEKNGRPARIPFQRIE